MAEAFYAKDIDLSDTKTTLAFLQNHFRYDTMRSWNRSQSFANNVKIHNLGLPKEITDDPVRNAVMWDLISGEAECPDYDESLREIKQRFTEENPGYEIAFNGRSAGYLVLYHKDYPGRSINVPDEDCDESEIKQLTELVMNFDEACDEIRQLFIETIMGYESIDVEQTIVITSKLIVPKDR